MIPIVCIDDKNGTMFNRRRQSQDRLLRSDVLREAAGRRLWMNAYSYRQFAQEEGGTITVEEDFLQRAGAGELCFVEGLPLLPHLERMEGLILYRWNRVYPADTRLDLPVGEAPWTLLSREEFPGSSHERITKEVYGR